MQAHIKTIQIDNLLTQVHKIFSAKKIIKKLIDNLLTQVHNFSAKKNNLKID
jgi:hypothetical protein